MGDQVSTCKAEHAEAVQYFYVGGYDGHYVLLVGRVWTQCNDVQMNKSYLVSLLSCLISNYKIQHLYNVFCRNRSIL